MEGVETFYIISAANLSAAWGAFRMVLMYTSWVLRDWNNIFHTDAGIVLLVVIGAGIDSLARGLIYGVGLMVSDSTLVDVWTNQPWVTLLGFSRTMSFITVMVAVIAKKRMENETWSSSFLGAGMLMLEMAAVFFSSMVLIATFE